MKVLITFAVDAEFGPWEARHKFEVVRLGNQTLHQARIGETEVAVMLTGIGPKIARANVAKVLNANADREAFDVCVSTGLAGALRPEHAAGDILAAQEICMEVEDARLRPAGLLAHPMCLWLASECGARIVPRLRTSARLILTSREKSELAPTADAVEMESFEVLSETAARGIRGIAIRAIGDAADEDLPLDFNQTITPEGTISTARILVELAKRPSALPGLLRFARQSRDAAIALADYLDRYIAALAEKMPAHELEADELVAAT